MAVVQYSNVYRTGAPSGSPVTSLYVIDTSAEFPVGIPGDVAFVKDLNSMWLRYNAGGWAPIWNGGTVYNDIALSTSFQPQIALIQQGTTSAVRLYNIGGAMHLSTNCWFDGGAWHLDNINYDGIVFVQNQNNTHCYLYRIAKPDGTVFQSFDFDVLQGNLGFTGLLFPKSRNVADGVIQEIPFSSGNFIAGGGTGGIFTISSQYTFCYHYQGNTITMSWWVDGTASGSAFNPIHFYLPNGHSSARYISISCPVYDGALGLVSGSVQINPGQTYVTIFKPGQGNWTPGFMSIQGQMTIPLA